VVPYKLNATIIEKLRYLTKYDATLEHITSIVDISYASSKI